VKIKSQLKKYIYHIRETPPQLRFYMVKMVLFLLLIFTKLVLMAQLQMLLIVQLHFMEVLLAQMIGYVQN